MRRKSSDVFVVYGRNELAKEAVFAFLRGVGLNPLEWEEVVTRKRHGGAPYIGDVLLPAIGKVCAVVVVCTGDDEFRLREEIDMSAEFSFQPRGNVLFEAGLALAEAEERTVFVHIGSLQLPTDLVGRWTIRLDELADEEREKEFRVKLHGILNQIVDPLPPKKGWLDTKPDFRSAILVSDYKGALDKLYAEHVDWWTKKRPIAPRVAGEKGFGDAPVEAFMAPLSETIPDVTSNSNAYDLMRKVQARLLGKKKSLLPVAIFLESNRSLKAILTPTDLTSKFDKWYNNRSAVASEIWSDEKSFGRPLRSCFQKETCREAYHKMLLAGPCPIQTGLPVVDETGRVVGFLPHHGGREDWR